MPDSLNLYTQARSLERHRVCRSHAKQIWTVAISTGNDTSAICLSVTTRRFRKLFRGGGWRPCLRGYIDARGRSTQTKRGSRKITGPFQNQPVFFRCFCCFSAHAYVLTWIALFDPFFLAFIPCACLKSSSSRGGWLRQGDAISPRATTPVLLTAAVACFPEHPLACRRCAPPLADENLRSRNNNDFGEWRAVVDRGGKGEKGKRLISPP